MDNIDWAIIEILKENCRTSYGKIAQKLSLSTVAIYKRVSKLISGHIVDFILDINPQSFGYYKIKIILPLSYGEDIPAIEKIIPTLSVSEIWRMSDSCHLNAFVCNEIDFATIKNKLLCVLDRLDEIKLHKIFQQEYSSKKYSAKIMNVLRCVAISPRSTSQEISDITGIPPKSVQRIIRRLASDENINFSLHLNTTNAHAVEVIIKHIVNDRKTDEPYLLKTPSLFQGVHHITTEIVDDGKTAFSHFICESMYHVSRFYDHLRTSDETKLFQLSFVMDHTFYSKSNFLRT